MIYCLDHNQTKLTYLRNYYCFETHQFKQMIISLNKLRLKLDYRKNILQVFPYLILNCIPINFTMYSFQTNKSIVSVNDNTPRSSYLISCDEKNLLDYTQLNSQLSIKTSQISMENKIKISQKTNRSVTTYQYSSLIQQNKALRKQLYMYKNQSGLWTEDQSIHQTQQSRAFHLNSIQYNKKQEQQIKQLRNLTQILKKQCQQNDKTINQVNQKIENLQNYNRQIVAELKKYKMQNKNKQNQFQLQKLQLMAYFAAQEKASKQIIKQLKDKTNKVMDMYSKLQAYANQSQMQWTIWKDKWEREKAKYLDKIFNLQTMINCIKNVPKNNDNFNCSYKINKLSKNKTYELHTDRDNKPNKKQIFCKNLTSSYNQDQYIKRF